MISGGYHFTFFHSFVAKSYDLITLAGQPAQIEYAGMERLTLIMKQQTIDDKVIKDLFGVSGSELQGTSRQRA